MVDIEGVYWSSHTIQKMQMLYSESSDSGIASDYNSDGDTVSVAELEVDYSKKLQDAIR